MIELVVTLLVPTTFIAFLLAERWRPARDFPTVRGWVLKGFLFFVLSGAVGVGLPGFVAGWAQRHRLMDGARLGIVGGAIAVVAAMEVLSYAWHRLAHRVYFLWRWTHQMHHSAERVDVAGAFYFHPLELLVQASLGVVAGMLVLGVRSEAAAIAGYVGLFLATFQHLNVRTPRWLGYVIQRPEAHAIHHERGVHAFNYGNFALLDQLFGTYRNPSEWSGKAGFYDGASRRLAAMMFGRDVMTPPATTPVREASTAQPVAQWAGEAM